MLTIVERCRVALLHRGDQRAVASKALSQLPELTFEVRTIAPHP